MRDYSKVSASFWTGKTGKSLRGDMQTQIVAMYLMTSPHANMIGVFTCPAIYIAHETGSPLEGATKGLKKLCEGGFCTYDDDTETVWVHEMAKYQIGDELKPADNRVKDIQKQYENLPEGRIKSEFFAKYSTAFHLKNNKPLTSPLQAPTKPETETETETETGTGAEDLPPPLASAKQNGTRLPDDWKLPKTWGEWALSEKPELNADDVRRMAETFKDHWIANANRREAKKADWEATWRNWVRNQKSAPLRVPKEGDKSQAREGARKRLFGENQHAEA